MNNQTRFTITQSLTRLNVVIHQELHQTDEFDSPLGHFSAREIN
jgi:hypothetical protein